jgi:hypothetical protein
MPRTVTAVVTAGPECLGTVGPFPVDVPWWAEMESVVAHLEEALGTEVVVLRLLDVEGSDGARDGHVRYHVAVTERPQRRLAPYRFRDDDHPLRLPWARLSGIADLLRWAARHVDLTGRPEQVRSWNLSGMFRLPTADGPVWLKATPPFAAAEPHAIAAFAAVDPGLVPTVLASAPGRLLMADIPGVDCWDAAPDVVAGAVRRLVEAQARLVEAQPRLVEAQPRPTHAPAGPPDQRVVLPDRRPHTVADAVRVLLDGPVGAELSPDERAAARALEPRWELLAGCGLPDTVVHGDFHPGNWRSDGGPPVVFDFADAHVGNPVLDGLRAIDFLPVDRRATAEDAWVGAWLDAAPGSRPAEALRIADPLAHLAYAVRYQEFLDGIEPSERVYHLGDPAASIRHALAAARRQTEAARRPNG